jgi:hypothetical protein
VGQGRSRAYGRGADLAGCAGYDVCTRHTAWNDRASGDAGPAWASYDHHWNRAPEDAMPSALDRGLACLLALLALGGCAAVPRTVVAQRPAPAPRGLVVVVDGAGGGTTATDAVAAAIGAANAPLAVRRFDWTHGRGRGLADMTDVPHAAAQGRRLAATIASHRAACPHLPISLVCHSAGSMVVLAAADVLPPDSVESIVLLAPAVSTDFDLRGAMRAARRGVDAFTSEHDRFWLGVGTNIVGTADGKRGVDAAGRVGFAAPPLEPCEAALSGRLRQHPWHCSVAWTGNRGDHDGTLRSAYFRAYVLPVLLPAATR